MTSYFPPRENVPIFDASLFIEENSPDGNSSVGTEVDNLPYVRIGFPQQTIGATASRVGAIFPQFLTLPTAGTWKIGGTFLVNYTSSPAPVYDSAGFFINIGSPATTNPTDTQLAQHIEQSLMSSQTLPQGLGILREVSTQFLYIAPTANKVISVAYGVYSSDYGTKFSGNLYAYKISTTNV